MTQGCVMTLSQGHISKVKVTALKCEKLVLAITLYCINGFEEFFIVMLLLTKRCDMTLTQGHIFKVKVTVYS